MILFDFDGTLVDSEQTMLAGLNQFCRQRSLPEINDINIIKQQHRMRTLWRYHYHLFAVRRAVLDYLQANITACSLPDGCLETLLALSQHYPLGIISSNRSNTISNFLQFHNISQLFSRIECSDFWRSKQRIIKTISQELALTRNDLFYVCDQANDIEATQRYAQTIAVTWGYDSAAALAKHQPDALIDSMAELPALIAQRRNSK